MPRSPWRLIEKLAPIVRLEELLGECSPVIGLEDFFDEAKAQVSRHEARNVALAVARRHYRSDELPIALERIDQNAEHYEGVNDRRICSVWFALGNQIRKRHGLPRIARTPRPTTRTVSEDGIFPEYVLP